MGRSVRRLFSIHFPSRLAFVVGAALVVGAAMVAPSSVAAQSDAQTDAQERDVERARLDEIERRRRENARRAEALRNRAAQADEALEALKGRLVDTADSLRAAETRATEVEETLGRLEAEEAEASENLDERQAELSRILGALLRLERARPPALAVSPDDATKAAQAAIALAGVTPELLAEADRLQAQLDRIDRLRRERAAERAALEEAETALGERRRLLEELLRERETARAEDTARLAALEAEDRRLAREATNLRELVAGIAARKRMTDEEEEAAAPIRRSPTAPDAYARLPGRFSAAKSLLTLPAAGRVLQGFGDRVAGVTSDGILLETRTGAVVTTPFDGVVDWAEPFGRLGNVVIVDLGEDYRMVLIGLARLDVRGGQEVRAGEPLGVMGSDGRPARLKFQLRRRDAVIDPAPWLRPGLARASGAP